MNVEVFSFRPLLVFIFLFGACTVPLELEPPSKVFFVQKTGNQQEQLSKSRFQYTAFAYERSKNQSPPKGHGQ
jgi:hypothetical protein